MTGHDKPTDEPLDPVDAAVDQRLTTAARQARATTHTPDRHAFLAAARTRRDRLRRRRRAWTIATPVAAAVIVIVAVGVIASGGDNTSMNASTGGRTEAIASSASAAPSCPDKPGAPNTAAGRPMFDFTPTALALCTYGVDGRLLATNAVPGPNQPNVSETLDYLQRAYVDQSSGSGEPNCADDEIAVNRIGVIGSDDVRTATAWISSVGCTTPRGPSDGAQHERVPESGSAVGATDGSPADTQSNPPPDDPTSPASP